MLYWSSRLKNILILKPKYFLTLFVRKSLRILTEQKKVKSLKTRNFDQTPKGGHLRIAASFE